MPTFVYESIARGGQATSGTIEAADRAEAVRLLSRRGEVPTSVSVSSSAASGKRDGGGKSRAPAARSNGASTGVRAGKAGTRAGQPRGQADVESVHRGGGMGRGELASFIREIATALEAGLPLMNALRAVAHQAYTPRQRAILQHLMSRIEAGRSFAQAASEWGSPFNHMIVGMIRAGEASGRLDEVMLQLADLLDNDTETRRSVVGALVYPAILIVLLVIGVTVIVTVIIPRVLQIFEGEFDKLPLPTRIVHGAAMFMTHYWLLILAGVVLAVVVARWAMSNPVTRLEIDRFVLKLPVVGPLLRDVSVGRFTRTLGTLMGSGIPVIDSLSITRDTLGNRAMEAVIDDVVEQVRSGKSIADPMEKSGYFPPLLIQIIGLGERSGRLDTMLTQAANSLDRKTRSSIKIFTAVLPPLIVVVMALVVGFVLAAVLLPLIEMQSAIG
ncbi:MAG: hypothetical protein HND57_15815 [Planctomycetes bacterium]|nr:hypothetical protein [Planctomycetota bacterium]